MVYNDNLDINKPEDIKDFREEQEQRRKLLITAVNSTVLYLLAYLIFILVCYLAFRLIFGNGLFINFSSY